MNVDVEIAPEPKLKSVVAFRLPMAYTGGGICSDGDKWTTYQHQYIKIFPRLNAKLKIWFLSGSYGCSWIDVTDEETINYIISHLKKLGHTDVVIEEKLVIDEQD